MISPHQLSGCRIDGAKEKLWLSVDSATAVDLGHRRLWRNKTGHDSVGGAELLIAGIEIQETFPEKPTCGCVIDTERERGKSIRPRTDSARKNPFTRLTVRRRGIFSHIQLIRFIGENRAVLGIIGFHSNRRCLS